MDISIEEVKNILQVALKGNDFSEIYYEKNYGTQILMENGKIEKLSSGIDEGLGIRIIKDGKTKYGYTNAMDYKSLLELAEKLNILNMEKENVSIKENLFQSVAPKTFKEDYKKVQIEDKIDLLRKGYEKGKKIAKYNIEQITGSYSDVSKEIIIINSEGANTKEFLNRGILRFTSVMSKGELVQTGYDSKATTNGFEFFRENIQEEMIKEAIRVAETMLEANPPISGKMDVILSGKAGGTMIHEACGHGLELDLVQDNISIFKDKLEEKVANEKVTVIDSGLENCYFGSTHFDGEGNKTEKTILIEDGILKKYMNSKITADKEGIKYTGNGRRQGYKNIPIPRMRNTYIKAGKDKLKDMLRGIEKGIYVIKMGGGQVDTVTGDFVFNALESYIIENGNIGKPLKNVTLSGNGKDVLKNITHVGSDLNFTVGMCGKGGQSVPVTTGQPTIRIKNILVGGTV